MRDVRLREDKPSISYGAVFAFALTVGVAAYSWLMSNPHVLLEVPGVAHYVGHEYEKTNEQKRLDAHGLISEADRQAMRLMLEAAK